MSNNIDQHEEGAAYLVPQQKSTSVASDRTFMPVAEGSGEEEAAKEWNIDYESSSDLNTDLETAFKAGASWQATQPVSDAVEQNEIWQEFYKEIRPYIEIKKGGVINRLKEKYTIFKSPVKGKTYR